MGRADKRGIRFLKNGCCSSLQIPARTYNAVNRRCNLIGVKGGDSLYVQKGNHFFSRIQLSWKS